MPAFDRVQVLPGTPRIFAIQLTTAWVRLPRIPEGTYTVTLKHRAGNTAAIYLADHDSPAPGGLDRMEWASTEGILFIESANVNLLYARAASGTQVLEIIAQKGQIGPT